MRRRRQRESDAEVTLGKRDSDTWQAVNGRVVSLLSDDEADERHQRLILDVRGGQTLLVAHNIDLADRVPVSLGDRLSLRGLFEWNPQGGLIHWTHHDPMGIEEGGFIEHNGKRYR